MPVKLRLPSELRVLAGLLRSPRPGASYAVQVEPTTLPRGEVLDVAGLGRMCVRNAGAEDGSLPVVLLHGWTWNADLTFAGLYGPLAEHHRLIAPDVLGHGRSARPEGVWRIEDASAGVIALLDHLGVDRAIVAGFSGRRHGSRPGQPLPRPDCRHRRSGLGRLLHDQVAQPDHLAPARGPVAVRAALAAADADRPRVRRLPTS